MQTDGAGWTIFQMEIGQSVFLQVFAEGNCGVHNTINWIAGRVNAAMLNPNATNNETTDSGISGLFLFRLLWNFRELDLAQINIKLQ